DLQEAALALIKDWSQKHKKRLLLLIDNFDVILDQIHDERENARLRNVLMNDGTMMIIGTATTFFREARGYDQPLYNFFQIFNLEKLLDEVTPYYKAKMESLPPQQRKILDHIARVSGKTSEGLTPSEIAEATRLTVNQVSAQLKRLSDLGYVRAANLRERSSY